MPENYKKMKRHISFTTVICAALAVIVLGVSAILMMETEISPAKIPCPNCRRKISHGMDYCNFCGAHVTEKLDNDV